MMEKYHYRPEGAKTKADEIVMPYAKDALTAGFIRRNRKNVDTDDLGWIMLEKVADEETLEKIDNLPLGEFAAFMQGWQKESTPNLGES